MKSLFAIGLPNYRAIYIALSTLILLSAFPAHAEDYTAPSESPSPLLSDRPDNSTFANTERQERLDLLMQYVRHDLPAMLPGLPQAIREPADFVTRQFKGIEDSVNDEDTENSGSFASFFAPVLSLMHPSEEQDAESVWLAPGYHHTHGMLPFDDAVMLGFNYRNTMFDNRLKFTVHPFYAQSWNSGEGYWGTEFAIGLGPGDGRSWGAIVVRYDNGNSNLMDNNAHGIDMHADLKFDHGWSLSAGAQSTEEGDLGNYAMIKWKMKFGE